MVCAHLSHVSNRDRQNVVRIIVVIVTRVDAECIGSHRFSKKPLVLGINTMSLVPPLLEKLWSG